MLLGVLGWGGGGPLYFEDLTDLTVSKSFSEAFSALLMQVGHFWRGDVEY